MQLFSCLNMNTWQEFWFAIISSQDNQTVWANILPIYNFLSDKSGSKFLNYKLWGRAGIAPTEIKKPGFLSCRCNNYKIEQHK